MSKKSEDVFKLIESEKKGTTAEEVVARLREMIQNGELSAGDQLPPERDLAKLLGVSRPTLRTGIRSLTTVGILQSKQGAGNYVAKAEESPTLDENPLRMMATLHGFTSKEMFETCLSMEMTIASLAAERIGDEQIEELEKEFTAMKASLKKPEKYVFHDKRFHKIIASASGNRVLISLRNMMSKILFETRDESFYHNRDLKKSIAQHELIFEAIRNRNAENASQTTHDLLLEIQETDKVK